MQQQPMVVSGEIISLVNQNSDWVSLDIEIVKPNLILGPKAKIRLTWQTPPDTLAVGQTWEFTFVPKSISSVLNQGGYNEQKQLISQHIIGKGRVIRAQLLAAHFSLRNHLISKLTPELLPLTQGDILLALILGDRQLISQEKWQALRQTGTGHLVAISGLHLSVIAAWLYVCGLWLLTRLAPHPSRRNLLLALSMTAGFTCFYAYLAGFAVSTQRALVMMLLVMLLSILRRFSSAWERLLFALFIVLLIDPLACLSAGFWLSFGALAIILYTLEVVSFVSISSEKTATRTGLKQRLAVFWAIQWRLTLVLGCVQAVFFGGVSIHSLWMNILAVPWFSFVVIPLAMLGFGLWCLGSAFGQMWSGILQLADWALKPYGELLSLSHKLPAHWLIVSDSLLACILCVLLALLLWANIPRQHQYLLWWLLPGLLCMPLGLWGWRQVSHEMTSPPLANFAWTLHVLDVGQGLAVVLEQDGRALIYDTGASFGEFSYSEQVLVPFLQARGLTRVDYIVVSHGDNDHAGGATVLIQAYPTATWITDVAHLDHKVAALGCQARQIQWQRLNLSFIAISNQGTPHTPTIGTALGPAHVGASLAVSAAEADNNVSCVLRVDDGTQSALLTGDIESETEVALVGSASFTLKSQVLIAPHHGSRTSSTLAFIEAVAPEVVLFPAGLHNRYGFPKSDVVARYQSKQIRTLTAGIEGQISIHFAQNAWEVSTYRHDLAPFWYNRLFRFGDLLNPE